MTRLVLVFAASNDTNVLYFSDARALHSPDSNIVGPPHTSDLSLTPVLIIPAEELVVYH